ncbi:MAG: hypothetical protein QF569_10465 [Candidatus Poribacteria bacterium]|jgi:hypothetical protein|nr:hypothetical protein [Candidatus Poribacteria bacterium]
MRTWFVLITALATTTSSISQDYRVSQTPRLEETQLTIPQVDYENAINDNHGDPLPYIDF